MNPRGQRCRPRPGMKARLIPDDNMFGLRIAVRELLEKTATQFQADGRKKLELGANPSTTSTAP